MKVQSIAFPIRTERLELRPFTLSDLDDTFEFHRRKEVVRYLYWEPKTREETRKTLEKRLSMVKLSEEGDALVLAVVLSEAQKLAGEVSLFLRSREHLQGEIGFVFNPAYQHKGYATEACEAILRAAFHDFGFHRVYGRCDARNVSSYGLMTRLGMRREAHFVENEMFKGEWSDEYLYAILQSEWNEAHKRG